MRPTTPCLYSLPLLLAAVFFPCLALLSHLSHPIPAPVFILFYLLLGCSSFSSSFLSLFSALARGYRRLERQRIMDPVLCRYSRISKSSECRRSSHNDIDSDVYRPYIINSIRYYLQPVIQKVNSLSIPNIAIYFVYM